MFDKRLEGVVEEPADEDETCEWQELVLSTVSVLVDIIVQLAYVLVLEETIVVVLGRRVDFSHSLDDVRVRALCELC